MPSFDLHFTTAVLYAVTALAAWLPAASTANVNAGATRLSRMALMRAALIVGLICHGAALGYALFSGEGLNIGFSHAVSLIVWLVMLAYTLVGFDNQLLRLVALYLAPIATVAAILPLSLIHI